MILLSEISPFWVDLCVKVLINALVSDHKMTCPVTDSTANKRHGQRPIISRVNSDRSIVSYDPYVSSRDNDVLCGWCFEASGIDTYDISRKTNNAFQYDFGWVER